MIPPSDPETGSEAYIPVPAPERRQRAIDIWAETGRRLGAGGHFSPEEDSWPSV